MRSRGSARLLQRWFEPWNEIRWDIEEVIDAGEQVLAVFTIVARGKGSGMEITQRAFMVCDVRDGKVWRAREFLRAPHAPRRAVADVVIGDDAVARIVAAIAWPLGVSRSTIYL